MQQQQKRSLRSSAHPKAAAAAVATANDEMDRSDSEISSEDCDFDGSSGSSEGSSDAEGEQQLDDDGSHSTLHEAPALLQQQQRQSKRQRRAASSDRADPSSKRRRSSSAAGAGGVAHGLQHNSSRLPLVELPGGGWRVESMVSSAQVAGSHQIIFAFQVSVYESAQPLSMLCLHVQ
jgi:hypothetical protein